VKVAKLWIFRKVEVLRWNMPVLMKMHLRRTDFASSFLTLGL